MAEPGRKKSRIPRERKEKKPATSYSRTGESRTTLGDGGLDFRVRNENGYGSPSVVTGKSRRAGNSRELQRVGTGVGEVVISKAARLISTDRLNASLRLHPRPIEVLVWNLTSGTCVRENVSWGRLGA